MRKHDRVRGVMHANVRVGVHAQLVVGVYGRDVIRGIVRSSDLFAARSRSCNSWELPINDAILDHVHSVVQLGLYVVWYDVLQSRGAHASELHRHTMRR